MRRVLFLVNPLFKSRRERHLPRLLRIFEQAGISVEVLESGPNRAAGDKARRAVEQGIDAVIVCGGDGTVFDALQGLAGSEIPLGICPFGTGNILAQNLKIPTDPVAAAQWLLSAKPRSVPLGKITCCAPGGKQTWFFAMAAGMGIHAAMMEVAHNSRKYFPGKSAYFAAGLQLLVSHPIQPFEIDLTTINGEVLHRQASELIAVRVAELNLWRPGGGLDLPFLRAASIEGTSRAQLAQASFQALLLGAGRRNNGHSSEHTAARYEDIKRVVCRPIPDMKYEAPIAVEADGEILGASCATIEMSGLSISLLSHPAAATSLSA